MNISHHLLELLSGEICGLRGAPVARQNVGDFLRRLAHEMVAATLVDRSDPQLVEMAVAERDPAAFHAIVHRHGPMVYRVGWRVLRHPQDAEDAFQATFLILAQKLQSVRKRGVTGELAARRRPAGGPQSEVTGSRSTSSRPPGVADGVVPPDDLTWNRAAYRRLDFELGRLPEKWRLPLILCYLEGRTQDESANQLGLSKSTLRRRLEEGRAALGSRLNGRGITAPAAMSAVLLRLDEFREPPASGLIAATVKAIHEVASGNPLAVSPRPPRLSLLAEQEVYDPCSSPS